MDGRFSIQDIENTGTDREFNGFPMREIVGYDPDSNKLRRVRVGIDGGLTASFDLGNLSAFGSLETASLTPIFQGDFVYGLNTQLWSTAVTSGTGAAVDTNEARLRIQSGTGSSGYAYVLNRKSLRYRAGQGMVARFTPIFTAGSADNIQLWGVGSISANAPYDGYFFGFNGTSFGIVHYTRGTPAWTAQANWNGDKVNGDTGTAFNWDKTKGLPVQIKYPYLGFGDIIFQVQNPSTSRWVTVHVIKYANTVATTQVSNPTLYFMGFTKNSGNTANKILYCASVGVFVSGERSFISNPKWSIDNNKTGVTAETNIVSLKNATSYNGIVNQAVIRLTALAVSSSAASGVASIRLRIGATVGGAPSYTAINGTTADAGVTITSGNSIASYDTAGTTATGGTSIFTIGVDNPNSQLVNLIPYEIYIAPSEILTLSGFSTISSNIGVAVNWSEDI